MNDSRQPELAKPGAGIPTPERWIGNLGVRIFAARASKDRITRLFAEEAKRAVDLARELSVEQSRRRVLIDRFPGIEDSSRHWSVFMTLEHLVIANTIVADLIQRLCAGRETERTVHIRDLKPNPDAGPELVGELESLVARYGEIVSSHGELLTAKRHPHPWFGSLTARQWHALAALHNRIHRTQIERIVKVLRQGPSP